MIYYILFSYPIVAGFCIGESKENKNIVWVFIAMIIFAPIVLPIIIGVKLSDHE